MAALGAVRFCCRGKSLLLSSKVVVPLKVSTKILSTTSALRIEPIRGPFTPEEKKKKTGAITASNQWKAERVLSAALLGVVPMALFVQGPVIDHVLSLSIALHAHWGMQHVLTDYAAKFVPKIGILMYILSSLTFAGLIYFNYNDVGLTRAVQMLWQL